MIKLENGFEQRIIAAFAHHGKTYVYESAACTRHDDAKIVRLVPTPVFCGVYPTDVAIEDVVEVDYILVGWEVFHKLMENQFGVKIQEYENPTQADSKSVIQDLDAKIEVLMIELPPEHFPTFWMNLIHTAKERIDLAETVINQALARD